MLNVRPAACRRCFARLVLVASAALFLAVALSKPTSASKIGRDLTDQEIAGRWFGVSAEGQRLVRLCLSGEGTGLIMVVESPADLATFRISAWRRSANVLSLKLDRSDGFGGLYQWDGRLVGTHLELHRPVRKSDRPNAIEVFHLRPEKPLLQNWQSLREIGQVTANPDLPAQAAEGDQGSAKPIGAEESDPRTGIEGIWVGVSKGHQELYRLVLRDGGEVSGGLIPLGKTDDALALAGTWLVNGKRLQIRAATVSLAGSQELTMKGKIDKSSLALRLKAPGWKRQVEARPEEGYMRQFDQLEAAWSHRKEVWPDCQCK